MRNTITTLTFVLSHPVLVILVWVLLTIIL